MTDPLGVTQMLMRNISHAGRRYAQIPGSRTFMLRLGSVMLGLLLAGGATAQNILQEMSHTALPGGVVQLKLGFSGPVGDVQPFTTESPPRIALDLPETRNGLTQRRLDINAGATSGASAIEAAGRTRVVVDLFRTASFDSRVDGDTLILTIGGGTTAATSVAQSVGHANPTKVVSATKQIAVEHVDFRRGKAGEGRVIISFDSPGASADITRRGDRVVVDINQVKLPDNLAQRLDVLDFATPVQSIETQRHGSGVRLNIAAHGEFEQMAYQSGNEYVIEIAPLKEDPKVRGIDAEPVYSGSRVTFNFQDIPARSVLQLIADVSDLNIVVSDSVSGDVTLRLINVPWDQALDIVLQAKGLDKRQQGNVIWVAPQAEIAGREQALAEARLKREEQDQLISDYIPISYGNAKDIAALLTTEAESGSGGGSEGAGQSRGFLSKRGSVTFDNRTNTLLISDTPAKIEEIRQLISVLDRPVQQVSIESRIVIATEDFARELGARFGVSGGYEDSHGNVVTTSGSAYATDAMSNAALGNRFRPGRRGLPVVEPGGAGGGISVPSLSDRLNVNLPLVNPAGSFGLAILGADYLLDLELAASQAEGRSEVVSSPSVVTANQRQAVIKQGEEIGYVTYQAGGSGGGSQATVQFKEAVLELDVTPTITADDRVYLDLVVKKDALNRFIDNPGGGQVPQLDKREINTSVLVDNGQTVVLGGVYETSKIDSTTKVPLLGDVPILGNLFRMSQRTDRKAELLIFVTPRILSESAQ